MFFITKFILNQNYVFRTLIYVDFRKKYFGTLFGAAWATVGPLLNITLIYFVFHFGFKASHVGNVSFLNWLIAGMLPWIYISECINSSSLAFIENKHLITKIQFPVEILPTVKITSPLLTHFFLLFIFLLVLLSQNIMLSISTLPYLFYFIFCSFVLLQGIGLIVATASVFVRDTINLIQIVLQLLYWLTPIVWSPDMIPESIGSILKLNPLYYIIQGYRKSFFSEFSFETHFLETFIFWIFTIIIFISGKLLFKRLRPHFSDVL